MINMISKLLTILRDTSADVADSVSGAEARMGEDEARLGEDEARMGGGE